MKLLINQLLLAVISLFLTVNLLAQQESNLQWGPEQQGMEIPYELKQTEEGLTFLVYRNKFNLRIEHLNENNEVSRTATFDFEKLFLEQKIDPVEFFYVEGNYYYIAKWENRKAKKIFYYKYKINCSSLEMEVQGEKFLIQDWLGSPGVTKIHTTISPDKKLFAISYHMLNGSQKVQDVDSMKFKYFSSVYDAEWNELSSYEQTFSYPGEYFNWDTWGFVLNNNGSLLCSKKKFIRTDVDFISPWNTAVQFEQKEFYFLPFKSSILYKTNLFSKLREVDSMINEVSIMQTINTKDNRNLFCIVYRDYKEVSGICTGFSLVEFLADGSVKVFSNIPTPIHYLNLMGRTKSDGAYTPVWTYRNGEFALRRWVFKDFFKLGNKYYVLSEYSTNDIKLHNSPPERSVLARVTGDMIIYRFNSNLEFEKSFHIQKLLDPNCSAGTCDDLLGQGTLKSYSLVTNENDFFLYYWANEKSAHLLDPKYAGTRKLLMAKRNSKYLGLYKTKVSNSSEALVHTSISFDVTNPYRISINTSSVRDDKILFYGSKNFRYKIVELPLH